MVIQYLGTGLIAAAVALITLFFERSWKVKDAKKSEDNEILTTIKDVKDELHRHIETDDERAADGHRARILQFNNELIRNIPHTREEFIDVLVDIDKYKAYCNSHPNYKNSRAVHAIANINRIYDLLLEKGEFFGDKEVNDDIRST